jgi:hypothetical protein
MRYTTLLLSGLVASSAFTLAVGAESSKAVRQPDHISVDLGGVGTAIASAATGYNPAPGVFGFVGTYTCKITESEWSAVPSHILSKLSEALRSDGWVSDSPMKYVPVDAVNPVPLVVIASKADRRLEILITIFPNMTGATGIAYWVRNGPTQISEVNGQVKK